MDSPDHLISINNPPSQGIVMFPATVRKGKEEGREKHTSANIQNKCQGLRYSNSASIPLYHPELMTSNGSFRKNGSQSPVGKGEVKDKGREYVDLFSAFHSGL